MLKKNLSSASHKTITWNSRGIIPIPVILGLAAVAVISAFLGGLWIGKGHAFSIGMAIGVGLVFILPNLDRIIKWMKSVKGEITV